MKLAPSLRAWFAPLQPRESAALCVAALLVGVNALFYEHDDRGGSPVPSRLARPARELAPAAAIAPCASQPTLASDTEAAANVGASNSIEGTR